jgi:hypothetical protein
LVCFSKKHFCVVKTQSVCAMCNHGWTIFKNQQ